MGNVARRPDEKWRDRYGDAEGREHARHSTRKTDAQRWLDEVSASIVTGRYVAPKAGQITPRDFTEPWRLAQVHRPATAASTSTTFAATSTHRWALAGSTASHPPTCRP
jgi:hypothetical protein